MAGWLSRWQAIIYSILNNICHIGIFGLDIHKTFIEDSISLVIGVC